MEFYSLNRVFLPQKTNNFIFYYTLSINVELHFEGKFSTEKQQIQQPHLHFSKKALLCTAIMKF